MDALVLRDGKFYRNGEFVPLEFGNMEQIAIIENQRKLMDAMRGDGLLLDVWCDEIKTYEVKTDFKCLSCGKLVYVDKEVDDESCKDELIGKHSCWHCKTKYSIEKNIEGDYVVKTTSK